MIGYIRCDANDENAVVATYQVAVDLSPVGRDAIQIEAAAQLVTAANEAVASSLEEIDGEEVTAISRGANALPGTSTNIM